MFTGGCPNQTVKDICLYSCFFTTTPHMHHKTGDRPSKHIPFHRFRYSHYKARAVSWQSYLYKSRVYLHPHPGTSVAISISPRARGNYSAAAMIAALHPALKSLSYFLSGLIGPSHLLLVLTKDSKRYSTYKTCVAKTAIRTDITIFIDWLALICFYTSHAKTSLPMFVCLWHH